MKSTKNSNGKVAIKTIKEQSGKKSVVTCKTIGPRPGGRTLPWK